MKILYILNVFPKLSETFILNEVLALQRQGIDVGVFAMRSLKEETVHRGLQDVKKLRYLPLPSLIRILTGHLYWMLKAPVRYGRAFLFALRRKHELRRLFALRLYDVKLIADEQPDHLHAHFGLGAANLTMLTFLLTGIPYTFTSHRGELFDAPPKNFRIKSLLSKRHVTVSEYNKRYLIDTFNVPQDRLEVVHCGVDLSQFKRLHQPTGTGANRILSVGRLEPMKGMDMLIRSCALLKHRGLHFSCDIIGEGSQRSELERLIRAFELESTVHLLGAQSTDTVRDRLCHSSLMVLASRCEGIPVALMEAMALYVPVVSTRVRGIPELVEHEKSGLLVEPDNPGQLAEQIQRILNDPQGSRQLALQAYKKVSEEFNIQLEVEKLMRIWREEGFGRKNAVAKIGAAVG